MELQEISQKLKPCDMNKPYAFVSYTGADSLLVWADVLELQQRGYNVWLDEVNLDRRKEGWQQDALEAIEDYNCRVVLFFVSKTSLSSPNCLSELKHIQSEEAIACHDGTTVEWVAVDTEEVGNLMTFKSRVYRWLRDEAPLTRQKKKAAMNALHDAVNNLFGGNNDRVRIHPKHEAGRRTDYYTDLEWELQRAEVMPERVGVPGVPSAPVFSPAPVVNLVPVKSAKKQMNKPRLKTFGLAELLEPMTEEEAAARINEELYGIVGKKRSDIKRICFRNTLQSPARSAVDVSEAGDGSVLAWVTKRTLYFAGEGGIRANPDSAYLFACFDQVQEIQFNDNFDTSEVIDMTGMFAKCRSLQQLDISCFYTDNVADMRGMFDGCRSLQQLDLSHFNTARVTDMSWMFAGCRSLQHLNLSCFNTECVTNMFSMFAGCRSLQQLDVSHLKTDNVTDMKWMFAGCNSLQQLDLSHFNTARVTDMCWMFNECRSLQHLDISHFNTENVTDMHNMFYRCDSIQYLDISHFNMKKVTDTEGMLCDCGKIHHSDNLSPFQSLRAVLPPLYDYVYDYD